MATYTFNIRAEGLPIKDLCGSSDPYLVMRMPDQIQGDHNMVESKFNSEAFETGMEIGGAAVEAGVTAMSVVALTGCAGAGAAAAATVLAPVAISLAVPLAATQLYRVATKLHKTREGYSEIYSSEPIKHNLNPTWPRFQLKFGPAYHKSAYAKLLIEVWDWDRFSPSDYMGACEFTVKNVIDKNGGEVAFQLYDGKQRPKAGTLYIAATHDDVERNKKTHSPAVKHNHKQLKHKQEEEGEREQHKEEKQKHKHEASSQQAQQNPAPHYPPHNYNNPQYNQQYPPQYSYPPPNSFYPSHNDYYAPPLPQYNNYGYNNNNNNNYQPPPPTHNNYYGVDNNNYQASYLQKNEQPYANYDAQSYNQQYPTQYPSSGYPYQ